MAESKKGERTYRETKWEPGQEARVKGRAAILAARSPPPAELVEGGEATEPMPWGEFHDSIVALRALKEARLRLGLSLADVAERTGWDRAAISRLENGLTNPTIQTIVRYATGLRKSLKIILEDPAPGSSLPEAEPVLS